MSSPSIASMLILVAHGSPVVPFSLFLVVGSLINVQPQNGCPDYNMVTRLSSRSSQGISCLRRLPIHTVDLEDLEQGLGFRVQGIGLR